MSDALCHFALTATGVCRCRRCGNTLRSAEPERCIARCRAVRDRASGMTAAKRDVVREPCIHLGALTGSSVRCRGCPGSGRVHALFACAKFAVCLPLANVPGVDCCETCAAYMPDTLAAKG